MNQKNKMKFNILAILAIIIFCVAISPVGLQNDTFYTVKIGEHIMENGIDMQDPFSWHEGLAYTYPHWLYDVIMYLIYSIGGWMGIYLSTVVLSCILGITLYVTNVKLNKNHLISFLLTMGVMYLMKSYIAARAQLVTFILFVLTLFWIEKFLQTRKLPYAIGLIVIPILIANLHLAVWPFYFVLYLPFIAEYLVCAIVDLNLILRLQILWNRLMIKILRKKPDKVEKANKEIIQIKEKMDKIQLLRQENRKHPYKIKVERNKNIKYLILIMLICVLTGLCTPLGTTPYTYLIDTMHGTTTQSINEHLPLTLYNQKDILCIITAIIAFLMLIDIKIRAKDLFFLAGLALLFLMSRRQISMFLLIGIFIVNRLISSFIEKYDTDKDIDKISTFLVSWVGKIIILVIVVLISVRMIKPRITLKEKFINESTYPVEACNYILENIDINKMRIYNEYNYGSYMLYRGIPVFIDSRADLYAPEFNAGTNIFNDFINISNINTYYEDKFKEYDITHVIVYQNAKLNLFLSRDANYKQLYTDKNFVVYERNVQE